MWQAFFDFMLAAHEQAKAGAKVLNVYASQHASGKRETVYKEHFFSQCEYHHVDFWADRVLPESDLTVAAANPSTGIQGRYALPYGDDYFDLLVNTKIVLEHASEPEAMLREFHRVLKPGGEAFIPAPLVRRQHQKPHDYFRYTEYGLRYLCEKVGFKVLRMDHTNGFAVTATQYANFLQRGLGAPKWIVWFFDKIHYWIIEPAGFLLDKLDNGYGRDFTLYFLTRLQK
jgi:SAM-dependent methyltransferase